MRVTGKHLGHCRHSDTVRNVSSDNIINTQASLFRLGSKGAVQCLWCSDNDLSADLILIEGSPGLPGLQSRGQPQDGAL